MSFYARKLTLRTCGRFTVVASDFGASYRTHTHVTGEALYASLTRGATWHPRSVDIDDDTYCFARDYAVAEMPVWFTPGIFRDELGGHRLAARDLDANFFNSVHELYPSTSRSYAFDKGTAMLKVTARPPHVPTYGTWQSVLPDRRFTTLAFSRRQDLLDLYEAGETFLLGKKRAMVQIVGLTDTAEGQEKDGTCETPFIQLGPDGVTRFAAFEVAALTLRYIVIRGLVRESAPFWQFEPEAGGRICLPEFYLSGVLPNT